ncbi:MAG TPA: PaaI family thioesterase [Candidatus Brocadiia bacterium]|nr:PaaI family thioesterase [Candidatus Brocadiia bacterium]
MSQQRRDALLDLFNNRAPIARFFGMRLSYNEKTEAVLDMPYNPNLDHALGGIHGGAYAAMLDNAGWFTAAAAHDESCWVATSEISIRYLRPAKGCALRAVGHMLKSGKRQDVVVMELRDDKGNLVGHATGTFILLEDVGLDRALKPQPGRPS